MDISLNAMRAIDALRINQRGLRSTTEVLATGQRVNSASVDAASLGVSTVMTAQYQGLQKAVQNINDGVSLAQTAEAALESIGGMMQRMRELAVQAATGTIDDNQRSLLDKEYQALNDEILTIVKRTEWNGYRLLKELSPKTFDIQAGADAGELIPVTIPKVYATGSLVGFNNGDFESSTLGAGVTPGWTITNQRVKLDGTSTIAGWATPVDSSLPSGPGEAVGISNPGSFTSTIVAGGDATREAMSLQMQSSGGMQVTSGFGVVHGPYVVSNDSVPIEAGETVSFDWKAQGGDDSYDVYAYLLNVNDGSTVELLNSTGASSAWQTVTKTVPTAGDYKFVFVSGTYDQTGGRVLGARLFVDNIVAPPVATPDLSGTFIGTVQGANTAMTQLDADIESVLSARATVAASIKQLTHAADNLFVYSANLAESRSKMMDADYAAATTEIARQRTIDSAAAQVLRQAQTNMGATVNIVESNKGLFRG